jgi:hypothetical protein
VNVKVALALLTTVWGAAALMGRGGDREAERRFKEADRMCAWCGKLCSSVAQRDYHEDNCGL